MQRRSKALLSLSAAAFVIVTCACSQGQKVATEPASSETTVSSTPPFQIREPERYRATRTITTVNARGETLVSKNMIARDGESRRDETETAGRRVVYLTLREGRFILLPDEKLFASVSHGTEDTEEESETSPDRLLHVESITTGYQKLGAETIGARNLQKYRVVVNNSAGQSVSVGETLLWFDETLHMPVRTESTSPDGTRTTMELSDIVLNVSAELFQLPKDFQNIEFQRLQERLSHSER
jgi:outer membrane lipoprotein-sorting protein